MFQYCSRPVILCYSADCLAVINTVFLSWLCLNNSLPTVTAAHCMITELVSVFLIARWTGRHLPPGTPGLRPSL